ncbi:MAG: flavin reductase family protein [Desulfarculus sp.]|nr:flavin reductase family protein [Desulfarculus sp.]
MLQSLGAKPMMFPTPVWVVGSYDAQGKPNLMTAAWCGICCSKPPCLNVSLRKATYSHGNIIARKAFTLSAPSVSQAREADYVGMVSGRDRDKFQATGLTPQASQVVDAPYAAEFPLVAECRLAQVVELGLHTMFVGEIVDLKADTAVLDAQGRPDMTKLAPFVFAPEVREYFAVGQSIGKAFAIGKSV